MSVLLEAIEVIAEDLCAHVGALKVDPATADEDDVDTDTSIDWLYNGGLFDDLLDLADVANRAAAIVDRPRVRQYLAEAAFPRSPRLAALFALPVLVATEPTPAPAPKPVATVQPKATTPDLGVTLTAVGMYGGANSRRALMALANAPDMVTSVWLGQQIGMRTNNALRILRNLERRGLVVVVKPPAWGGRLDPATYRITEQFRAVLAPIAQGAAQ